MEFSMHSPIPLGSDAEILARRTLDALHAGDAASAVEISQYFSAFFPHMDESLVLHALALSQANSSDTNALQAWDAVLRRNPLQPDCLAQALRLAWRCNSSKYNERWIALLRNTFLTAPPILLLQELDAHGQSMLGSIGIHNGMLRGWTWQSLKGNDGLPNFCVETGSVVAPEINIGPIQRLKTADRVLNIFSLELPKVRGSYTVRVTNAPGRDVHGSPAVVSCPALSLYKKAPRSNAVAVIIPVYADRRATLACIGSVLASRKANHTPFQIVVVWDHGPDTTVLDALQHLEAREKITLHIPPHNMGFLGAVNFALERHSGQSVVLLNADTLVCNDWLDRLHRIGARPGVGTVTPFGTHAELLSFPAPQVKVPVTRLAQVRRLDTACRKANADVASPSIPVGVGFCLYIPRTTLDAVGGLDGHDLFRGYGEEVEFCLRVRKHGLRNVAACNVFVGHVGERSFGAGKVALAAQNNVALFAQYPAYKTEYDNFIAVDPMRKLRERAATLAIKPLSGTLHVASVLDGASPDFLYLDDQDADFALLLLQPCGARTRAMLRVRQNMPLPDLHFVLPRDFSSLTHVLTRLSPTGIVSHNAAPLFDLILDRAGFRASPAESTKVSLSSITLGATPGKWITPAPRTLADWQRLCNVARQAHKHVFKVIQLDAFWKQAPRPRNIWPAPVLGNLSLAADGLLLFGDAEGTAAWQRWAEDQGLAVHDMPAPAFQTRETLCA